MGPKDLKFEDNHSVYTKIAIMACKFSKIFRGSMPSDPPQSFFGFQSGSTLFGRKKNTFEKMRQLCPPPPPFKISRYATNPLTGHFQKCLLCIDLQFFHNFEPL